MHATFFAATVLLTGQMVSAHGWVNSWVIDTVSYDGFVPSDPGRFPVTAERPTDNPKHGWAEPNDPIVACGGASAGQGLETWEVQGGSSVTVNWISDDRLQPNMVWPKEHVGAIAEYMAECPTGSCDGVQASSLDWFKISEQGVDENGEWATDKLNRTRVWDFTIPEGIKSGAYLVRHELNAMHNPGAPQIYPVCFQAKVTSTGTGVPSETVKFPNAYADFSQDFKTIDVWKEQREGNVITYTPPGPRVATFDGSQTTPASETEPATEPSSEAPVASSAGSQAPAGSPIASEAASSPVDAPPSPANTGAEAQPTIEPPAAGSTTPVPSPPSSSSRSHRGGRGSHRSRRPRTC